MQAGEWGKFVGRADFSFKNGKLELLRYELIPVNLKKQKENAQKGVEEWEFIQTEIPADQKLQAKLKVYQDQGSVCQIWLKSGPQLWCKTGPV